MSALVKGLPRDALVRTPLAERGRDPWTAELELMAQLVEVVSVSAAEMKLRAPIKVPRPQDGQAQEAAREAGQQVAAAAEVNPYRGAMAVLSGGGGGRRQAPQPRGGDGTDPAYGAAMAMLHGGGPGS